tara:strand:- start:327 stop:446 length:120 start_codon:yes stop_codon:yes gene_type:complete
MEEYNSIRKVVVHGEIPYRGEKISVVDLQSRLEKCASEE